jgi:glycosyltransferase involved in cell wall biosynthesis
MKILNVVHNPNLDTGGKISHNLLMKELRDRGHEIQFLSTDQYQDFETFHMEDHIDVNSLRLRERKVEKEIRNHLKEHQYDYIYGNGYYAIPGMLKSAQDHNVKTVTHYRDYWFADVNGTFIGDDGEHYKQCNLSNIIKHSNLFRTSWNIYKWQYLKSRHSLLNTADYKIATSNTVKNKLESCEIQGAKVLSNPVQITEYHQTNPCEFEEYDNLSAPIVGFAGSLTPTKGTSLLKELIASFEDTSFLIAGNGSQYEELRTEFENRENVKFTGWLDRQKVVEMVNYTDIFLYPSLVPEGFGRVAVEAMAGETPIIASNRGGLKDIILDEATGYLVDPEDPEEWKKKLKYLLENQELRESMGKKGRKESLKYSVENHVNNFLGIIQ